MTYTLKITRARNSVVISIYENGQYVDARVFHVGDKRDIFMYIKTLMRKMGIN